jgi:ribosome-associated heat shock protein Hsp15
MNPMARIDKFIWAVRLTKTRTLASELCKKNKILVNDEEIKPSRNVKVNDVVTVKKSGVSFKYKVLAELEKRVGAKLVADYIKEITEVEELEKYKIIQMAQKTYRQHGLGRPTKKDRRDIDNFLD